MAPVYETPHREKISIYNIKSVLSTYIVNYSTSGLFFYFVLKLYYRVRFRRLLLSQKTFRRFQFVMLISRYCLVFVNQQCSSKHRLSEMINKTCTFSRLFHAKSSTPTNSNCLRTIRFEIATSALATLLFHCSMQLFALFVRIWRGRKPFDFFV